MLELIAGYILIAVALSVPLLLLAGIVWVLVRPLSLQDVERWHRERQGSEEPVATLRPAERETPRPGGPRRVA